MKEQLEKRLEELKKEFEAGQKMLAEIEMQRSDLQQKMLRISGAIQVLEEELNPERKQPGNGGAGTVAEEVSVSGKAIS